ncbi:hypothetical protein VKT23_002620 [Stygiomarasmius scandens]|uniref:Uncharacterized protein n=1 Tax=Marasmiellus scandens TaxID=2682957 RepID=A0ABR1K8K9_9AGAR
MFSVFRMLVLPLLSSVVFASTLSRTGFLHVRQTNIPDVCTQTCGTVPDNFPNCSPNFTPSKCCMSSFELELFSCYQCIGSTQNIVDYTPPQQTLDLIFVKCAAAGLPIDKLTLPGQDPNRNLPTSSVSPAQNSTPSMGSSSREQSTSQSTATSSSTPSSTPRSPVTETSGDTSGGATDSSGAAQTSPTDNAGIRTSVVDVPLLGLASVVGTTISTIYMLVL